MMMVLLSVVFKSALDITMLCLKPESAGMLFRISASFGLGVKIFSVVISRYRQSEY